MAWKPPSLFLPLPSETLSLTSTPNAQAAQGSQSTATCLRIHRAGNDKNGITPDPGNLDSDKDSHRAALP
ncbi:hypothetical protein C4K27_3729 [Pseudomonas chlororaphis subsp. chlororaphis]|nr:hypothetical protein C4K27_3729 [Pseudomonas chlororaphis subsp. chlororaphis]